MNIHVYHIITKLKHSELNHALYKGCFIFPSSILFSLMLMAYFHLLFFCVLNTNSMLPSCIRHILVFAGIVYILKVLSSPRNLSQSFWPNPTNQKGSCYLLTQTYWRVLQWEPLEACLLCTPCSWGRGNVDYCLTHTREINNHLCQRTVGI